MDEDTIQPGKRITLKRTRPNPLFQSWLEELHEEAKEKKSKLENVLNEALTSLSKYPLPLQSGAECAILNGFDRRLCVFLDKRLEVYNDIQKAQSSLLSSETEICKNINDLPSTNVSSPILVEPIDPMKPAKIAHATSPVETDSPPTSIYKPQYRSAGYALLVALLKHANNNEGMLNRDALIENAQKYFNDSFASSDTAWFEMITLIRNGLVNRNEGDTITYSLSNEGFLVANGLLKDIEQVPASNDSIGIPSSSKDFMPKELDNSFKSNYSPTKPGSSNSLVNDTVLEPNSFDIVLLIDKNETNRYVLYSPFIIQYTMFK